MSEFAKMHREIMGHEKAHGARLEAMGLWSWGMGHCRFERTNGDIAESAARAAWGCEWTAIKRAAAKLVAVGLWEKTDSGWRMLRYAPKNDTKESIEAAMAKTRGKVDAWRNRKNKLVTSPPEDESCNRLQPVDGHSPSLSDSDSDPEDQTDQNARPDGRPEAAPPPSSGIRAVADPPPKRPPGGVSAWDLRARELYVAGIRRGTGAGFVWPDGYGDQGRLNQAVLEFARSERTGKALTGGDLAEWIEAAAFDFARDVVRKGKAEFGFGLKYFVTWLTADEANRRQAAEARACP